MCLKTIVVDAAHREKNKMLIRFFRRNVFRKEILLVILIKLAGLFILWNLFFSHPVTSALDRKALIARYL